MLKLAGRARGGNSLKLSSHFTSMAGAMYCRKTFSTNQSLYLKLSSPRSNGSERRSKNFGIRNTGQLFAPDIKTFTSLLREDDFVSPHSHGHAVAIIAPVDDALARALLLNAGKERQQVIAVEVDPEGLIADLVALFNILDQIRLTVSSGKVGIKSWSEQMSLMTLPG